MMERLQEDFSKRRSNCRYNAERDWRESDDFDHDTFQNYEDLDIDNDGILNVNEGRGNKQPYG